MQIMTTIKIHLPRPPQLLDLLGQTTRGDVNITSSVSAQLRLLSDQCFTLTNASQTSEHRVRVRKVRRIN